MPNKDLISKKILKRLLVEFSTQLFGLNIVDAEPLDTEQPRIEGKRADLVARVKDIEGKSYILHVEIQNNNQAHFPIRMLRYYTDLALTYPDEEIKQYLLYMGKADLTIPDHIQTSGWRYCYQILDISKHDSEDFLNSANPDALVLAILCDFKGRDPRALVAEITRKLRRLHGDQLDSLRESLVMLDILATNRDLQNLVKETSAMFIEVEKLGIYQLAMERGLDQGEQKGLQKGLQRGRQEGLQEGLAKGEQMGLQKAITALARRGLSVTDIAHSLDLSESEVAHFLN